jgi:hypothetical protein
MIIKINIVEVSSELAYNKLMQHYEDLGENRDFDFPDGIEIDDEEEGLHYSEEAQKVFDEFYDEFYTILENFKITKI